MTFFRYKDGVILFMENRMLAYTDRRGVCRLNIMNSKMKDAGEYTCSASNKAGKDTTHCSVRISG